MVAYGRERVASCACTQHSCNESGRVELGGDGSDSHLLRIL